MTNAASTPQTRSFGAEARLGKAPAERFSAEGAEPGSRLGKAPVERFSAEQARPEYLLEKPCSGFSHSNKAVSQGPLTGSGAPRPFDHWTLHTLHCKSLPTQATKGPAP